MAKDDDSDVNRTQDGKFVCFLEETALALEEGAVRSVLTGFCPMRVSVGSGNHLH